MHEAGLDMVFVQDNQRMSVKGVLRGLHFQKECHQGKLVRVIRSMVFDVGEICVREVRLMEIGIEWPGLCGEYQGSASAEGDNPVV